MPAFIAMFQAATAFVGTITGLVIGFGLNGIVRLMASGTTGYVTAVALMVFGPPTLVALLLLIAGFDVISAVTGYNIAFCTWAIWLVTAKKRAR